MKSTKLAWNIFALFLISSFFIIVSCEKENDDPDPPPTPVDTTEDTSVFTTTPWVWPLDALYKTHFPTEMNIPADNPMTVEGVSLGRYLFHDGRLAGRHHKDSLMSCSSCHKREYGFTNGTADRRGVGITGIITANTVLPIVNLVFRFPNQFTWTAGMTSIEDIALIVFTLHEEFYTTFEDAVNSIKSVPIYPPKFKAAFGTEEVTINRIAKAISQYVRSIISYNCKFHQYLRGESQLSPAELRGYQLYVQEAGDCFHCHGSAGNPLFTTNLTYNNGKDSVFTGIGDRYSITGDPKDKGAFKATTLLNCELYAPYMHDGRFATLRDVIDFYSEGVNNTEYTDPLMEYAHQGGVKLTESEKDDLLAFLKTLTDYVLVNDSNYAKPSDLVF